MGDIVMYRNGKGDPVVEGVDHDVLRHSPDGFNWGYEGSGPIELALNILDDYCKNEKDRDRLYRDFMFKLVAGIKESGGRIAVREVIDFLEENGVNEFK